MVLARAYRPQHDVRRIDGMTREELCRRYQARILQLARRANRGLAADRVDIPLVGEDGQARAVETTELKAPRGAVDVLLEERTRRRDGARRWSMMQDLDDPTRFVERYQALTWLDHLRQWQRATAADQSVRDRVLALHQGPRPPVVRHLWVREPDEFEPFPGTRPD